MFHETSGRLLFLSVLLSVSPFMVQSISDSKVRAKPELNILGLFQTSGSAQVDGRSAVVMTKMAIEHINNRSDILPDHDLKLFWRDTQCAVGTGIDMLYSLLYTPPVKHMILGAGCSIVCQPIAEICPRWNLTEMTYGCTSPTLSNKKKYPRFYRAVAPDTSATDLRLEIMRMFNWKKIATIHQSYEFFSATTDAMLNGVAADNVTVLLSASFLTDPTQQVENLKKHDARIIFSGSYEDAARRMFCEAYKKGLYGPRYAWFAIYWYAIDWWKKVDTECSVAEILEAMDGLLYVGMSFQNPENTRGMAGLNHTELLQLYDELTRDDPVSGRDKIAPQYDTLWTVALTFDRAVRSLKEKGHPKSLEDFTYADSDIGDVIAESIAGIDFQGVMGRIKFDENGDPSRLMMAIDQQQGEHRVRVGYYQQAIENRKSKVVWVNGGIKWRGSHPPRDATIIKMRRSFVSEALYRTMCVFAAAGIVSTAGFFAFNVYYRKNSLIKMSSPNINNVILLGCWLVYSTVFLQETSDSLIKEDSFCVARSFAFLVGFSLSFGALFSKTWRVHKILTMSTKKLAKVVIKDSKLVGIVLALVMINVMILVLREIIDPSSLAIRNLEGQVSAVDSDVLIVPQLHTCSREYEFYYAGAVYVIQGTMLAFGAFLAWETRNVKVEALNDSKQIGVCIYNVLTLSVLGTAVSLLVSDDLDISYGFTSAILIFGTTLLQCIIFVPKMLGVKRRLPAVFSQAVTSANVSQGASQSGSAATTSARPGAFLTTSHADRQPK